MKRYFMKQGEYISEGNKDQSTFSFLFFVSKLRPFFVSRMSVKESFMESLQRQFRKRLQKLKEEQKK